MARGHLQDVLLQFCGCELQNIITLIDLPDTAVVKMSYSLREINPKDTIPPPLVQYTSDWL